MTQHYLWFFPVFPSSRSPHLGNFDREVWRGLQAHLRPEGPRWRAALPSLRLDRILVSHLGRKCLLSRPDSLGKILRVGSHHWHKLFRLCRCTLTAFSFCIPRLVCSSLHLLFQDKQGKRLGYADICGGKVQSVLQTPLSVKLSAKFRRIHLMLLCGLHSC